MDIMGMMKKAQAVQAKLQEAQEELGRLEVEGQAGGGMVSLTLSAKGELKGVRIDASLLTPADKEMLEDLIVAAFSDGKAKADRVAAEKMQSLTAGPAPSARHEAAVLEAGCRPASPDRKSSVSSSFSRGLPGLGPRSARRVALHLIRKRETLLAPLADALRVAQERILTCSVCGNVDTRDPCTICSDERRDSTTLVVVESVGDLWALERAGATRARYHVLGGALSPLDGVGPSDLNLSGAGRARRQGRGERNDPCRQRDGRRPNDRALHHRSPDRLSRQGDAARAWRAGGRRARLSR